MGDGWVRKRWRAVRTRCGKSRREDDGTTGAHIHAHTRPHGFNGRAGTYRGCRELHYCKPGTRHVVQLQDILPIILPCFVAELSSERKVIGKVSVQHVVCMGLCSTVHRLRTVNGPDWILPPGRLVRLARPEIHVTRAQHHGTSRYVNSDYTRDVPARYS